MSSWGIRPIGKGSTEVSSFKASAGVRPGTVSPKQDLSCLKVGLTHSILTFCVICFRANKEVVYKGDAGGQGLELWYPTWGLVRTPRGVAEVLRGHHYEKGLFA